MKKTTLWSLLIPCLSCLLFNSCSKQNNDVWDDSSSNVGSYKRAKERPLWGSSEEGDLASASAKFFSQEDDFIPLQDEDLKQQFSDIVFAQPKDSPGEDGSFLPDISGFQSPTGNLAKIFQTLYFNTDEYNAKNANSAEIIHQISSYLKSNPKTYIFVAGHCDQRGPEAYNLSLGAKRANTVRTMLIQQGVNPEQIHTISYGKEKLADFANTPEALAKNRRAEFKLYTKR
jgi:peptidoglycan-associated lipoprotein